MAERNIVILPDSGTAASVLLAGTVKAPFPL